MTSLEEQAAWWHEEWIMAMGRMTIYPESKRQTGIFAAYCQMQFLVLHALSSKVNKRA